MSIPPIVQTFTFNPFYENTYVIGDPEGKTCIIVDPGNLTATEDRELLQWIASHAFRPVGIYCTHCHVDHVYGVRTVSEAYSLQPLIPRGELELYQSAPIQSQWFQVPMPALPEPQAILKGGAQLRLGPYEIHVLSLPGHSPDHIALYFPNFHLLFSGDVLFKGSIGRYDLPGSNYRQLRESLITLMQLPDETIVFPGHGPSTTIGEEKRTNPFLLDL